MQNRPVLSKSLDSRTFREYYYLKEELTDFCRENGLPVSGGKAEITERIALFLDTGSIAAARAVKRKAPSNISIGEGSTIEPDFVCSEKHRAFFKEHIGKSFSFNTDFQKWLKGNAGKTYREAIAAYYQIMKDRKKGQTEIGGQFEYNAYIRDFFADNKGASLKDAIACWNYKKRLPGSKRYESVDLAVPEGSVPHGGEQESQPDIVK